MITWYFPFCDVDPSLARKELLSLGWTDWADVVLSDLSIAHPDTRSLVTRLDVMRWGHAMIQPRVGFVSSEDREKACQPVRSVHFAGTDLSGTDLSGIALFEEAFYHGNRAADEILAKISSRVTPRS